jgi:hypothetical protein
MRKHNILFAALFALLLFAWPAFAANEGSYPHTIVDAGCTDDNATPAPRATPSTVLRNAVQTGGAADGFCDHDSRIVQSTLTEDTDFGPFSFAPGHTGILVYVDADDVTADNGTWSIRLRTKRPHDGVIFPFASSGEKNSEGNTSVSFGPVSGIGAVTDVDTNIPREFYIQYDEVLATAWDGAISWIYY